MSEHRCTQATGHVWRSKDNFQISPATLRDAGINSGHQACAKAHAQSALLALHILNSTMGLDFPYACICRQSFHWLLTGRLYFATVQFHSYNDLRKDLQPDDGGMCL